MQGWCGNELPPPRQKQIVWCEKELVGENSREREFIFGAAVVCIIYEREYMSLISKRTQAQIAFHVYKN